MFIKFFQNGKEVTLKTPTKIFYSKVEIKNYKKAICVVVHKKFLKEKKKNSLEKLGLSLLNDEISLINYYEKKQKIKFKKQRKTFIIKLKKDENTLVKIQNDLF